MLHSSRIVPRILAVQLVYLLDKLERSLAFLVVEPVPVLGNAALGRDPDTEEFVQVVGIDAEKGKAFQQGYVVLAGFLQDAAVEIHPTQVSFQDWEIFLLLGHGFMFLAGDAGIGCIAVMGPFRKSGKAKNRLFLSNIVITVDSLLETTK